MGKQEDEQGEVGNECERAKRWSKGQKAGQVLELAS